MGSSLGELYAELTLKTDKLNDGIKKSNSVIAGLERDIDNATEKINAKLATIGTVLSASVTLPLTLLGKSALDTFSNFEQSMQNTFSVMSASGAEMDALKKKAEEMGASTRFSASQASDALYNLGSAGQSANEAIKSLDGVLALAGATGSDLAFTSSTIASTLSQFNLTADKSSHIADVFSKAISKSQANMTKLSYSMKYVGPVASGLNVSLETSTAALMKLYNSGFGGEQAGTILRAGLQKLASGTDDLKSKLEGLGLSYDDVNPKTNDLADILERLKNANIDVTKSSELFGETAAAGMQKLIEGGGDAIRTMDGLLKSSDGAAKKMQDIQNASFANTKAELSSAFEAVQITLTSNVIPAVDMVAKGITNVLKFVNELPRGVQVTGTAFAGLAASAGPLLLVAVGIAKIKAEMVQLNIALLSNPITIWAAGIAAAGAVALGIIAQIKKAHEDAEKAAERYHTRAKKLADEAENAKIKNNKITSLISTYETLKDKTRKTAEEQEAYNASLNELKELIPDLIIQEDELGNKFIANAEKAKEAQLKLLEVEKEKTEHALLVSNLSANNADKNLNKYKKERDDLEKQIDVIKKEQEAAEKKLNEMQRLVDKHNATEGSKIKDPLESMIGDFSMLAKLHSAESEVKKTSNATDKYIQKLKTVNEKISEQEEILKKNKILAEKLANLKNLTTVKNEEPLKKTRKEYADEKWKDYEQQKKRFAEEKKDAKLLQQEYDAIEKRIEFVRSKINELKSISADTIADGQFTRNSEELQRFYQELERLASLQKQDKTPSKVIDKPDNSYQGQIERLDKLYNEKLSKAKEYGQSELAIQEEYEQKRFELIESFIKKEEEARGSRDNALTVETKKDSGVTLGEELNKTALMGDTFSSFLQQQKEVQEELDKTKQKIEELKALIETGDYGESGGTEEQAKAYLQELQKEANKLEIALSQSKFSLSQIDDALKNLDNSGKSSFKLKLIDIEEERKKAHKIIEEAEKNKQGKFKNAKTKEEVEAVKKEYQKAADDIATKSNATLGIGIASGIIGIADKMTNVIAGAVEEGGIDGMEAMKAAGDLLGDIGAMVGDPMTQAIIGGIQAAIGIFDTILKAVNAASVKAFNEEIKSIVDSTKETLDEAAGKIVDDIHKSIEEQAQAPMKEAASSLLQAITNGFKSGDFKDFSKSIDDIMKKMIVDKMVMFTGLNEAIQKLVNNMFKNFKGSGEQRISLLNTEREKLEAERDALEKEMIAYKRLLLEKRFLEEQSKYRWGSYDRVVEYQHWTRKNFTQATQQIDTELAKLEGSKVKYERLTKELDRINARIRNINPNEKADLTKIKAMDKTELDRLIKEYGDPIKEVFKALGIDVGEEFQKSLVDSASSALTNALGESAYNADWASFKKSFASEMKKAIIQSAVENAGLKEKVNAIIKDIMKDGKITGEEIDSTIGKLKNFYDGLENNMAELAKITKALEGGVEVKAKSSGSIIQQLSGADRDWFTEIFKEGFSKINQVIDLKETTIQHLQATQLIINSLNFTSYNGSVYITATENTNLKDLISELVKEALAS